MDNTAKRLEKLREKTVETVPRAWRSRNTPLKRGVNEKHRHCHIRAPQSRCRRTGQSSSFFCLLAACALLLASLAPARAMVRFDVFLGYDGIMPEASWFPVAFEIQNDGPSFTGMVEISPGQFNQNQTRLMAVELPTGTMKRFVVPVYSANRYSY